MRKEGIGRNVRQGGRELRANVSQRFKTGNKDDKGGESETQMSRKGESGERKGY